MINQPQINQMQRPSNREGILSPWLRSLGALFFVGIGGSGMRPLAEFCAQGGGIVHGSDLKDPGLSTPIQFEIENTSACYELLKISNVLVYSTAIKQDHPLMVLAQTIGLKIIHRSELLAQITEHFSTIAVAGTHGKSTTSALIVHCLRALGRDPSWIIGADFADKTPSFHVGGSKILVIEADESDGTLIRYHPAVTVVNNIDADHLDFYKTFDRLCDTFQIFMHNTIKDGLLVFFGDSPAVTTSARSFLGRFSSFGFLDSNQFHIQNLKSYGLNSEADVVTAGDRTGVCLPLPGRHNMLNAAAAIAAIHYFEKNLSLIAKALVNFPGVARRMQQYQSASSLFIFDDYAHNPGKIFHCLLGLRQAFPRHRLLAVFQPHRYSRVQSLYEEFITCFKIDNIQLIVLPIYGAGEEPLAQINSETMAQDIGCRSYCKTYFAASFKEALDLVKSIINAENDVVVTLGAGDVWKVAEELSKHFS